MKLLRKQHMQISLSTAYPEAKQLAALTSAVLAIKEVRKVRIEAGLRTKSVSRGICKL